MRVCRLNKKLKNPLQFKRVLLDHFVFLPKGTESHHCLEKRTFGKHNQSFPPTSPRSEKETTGEPQSINHSYSNTKPVFAVFDVSQHHSWCGVSTVWSKFTFTMSKWTETKATVLTTHNYINNVIFKWFAHINVNLSSGLNLDHYQTKDSWTTDKLHDA